MGPTIVPRSLRGIPPLCDHFIITAIAWKSCWLWYTCICPSGWFPLTTPCSSLHSGYRLSSLKAVSTQSVQKNCTHYSFLAFSTASNQITHLSSLVAPPEAESSQWKNKRCCTNDINNSNKLLEGLKSQLVEKLSCISKLIWTAVREPKTLLNGYTYSMRRGNTMQHVRDNDKAHPVPWKMRWPQTLENLRRRLFCGEISQRSPHRTSN